MPALVRPSFPCAFVLLAIAVRDKSARAQLNRPLSLRDALIREPQIPDQWHESYTNLTPPERRDDPS